MKKINITIIGLILLVGIININATAQDIHFSQFYASPLSLNPAETGFFEGNWRATNSFRTQWSAIGEPFNTTAFAVDKPFRMKNNNLGLGILFINDQSGSSKLNINKIYLSLNYIKTIEEKHTIGIGLQAGYVVKSFALNNITLPSQYNPVSGQFDSSMPNNLDDWAENINYSDINFGLNYSRKFNNVTTKGGISLFHINFPQVSFLRGDNTLPMRIAIHGTADISLHESYYARPSFISMHQKSTRNLVFGGSFHYILPENSMLEEIYAGVYTRTSLNNFDASIFTVGINMYEFLIGFSYDVNISPLAQASNMRGAFEISIIYKDISRTLNKIALPCERF